MQWLPVVAIAAGLSSCKKQQDVSPANTQPGVSQNVQDEPANNAPDTIVSISGINVSGNRMSAQAVTKTQIGTVGSTIIYSITGQNAFFFNAGMTVAAEGAPKAFNSNDAVALDYLRKAGRPGNWWSLVTNNGQPNGTPLIQPAGEPAPGYYISTTTLQNQGFSLQSQRCYINSASVPYIALPPSLASKAAVGDFGAIINKKTGAVSYVIFAEIHDEGWAGKASINSAAKEGINNDPKTGGVTSPDLIYIIFPKSGNGAGRRLHDIRNNGNRLLHQFGGANLLLDLFKTGTTTPAAPTVSITAPAGNASFTSPASVTITANAADADGTVSKVDFYNGTTLLGTDVTSPYSFSWTGVTAGNYTITAIATDNSGATTTSAGIAIVVKTPTSAAPTVSITAPANNANFTSPASVTINATAADADGTVSKVDFYNGTTLLGTDATSPYSFTWTNVAAGNYTITAKATDNSGNGVMSTGIAIVVKTPSVPLPVPPTVSVTSPLNGSTFIAPATLTLTANAADADGTVSKVDFYNGATLLGTDASSPYAFSWTNIGGGTYTITARATDNSGTIATSIPVVFTVNNPTPPPTASGFKVVGYLADWSGNVNQIQYGKLTHINYSFINTTASGSLSLGISTSRLSSVVSLAHAQGTKVCIAVGGWNNGDDSNFESMAASSTATNTFINNIVNFVSTYNLDGVDIDWEYPNTGSSATNYANMMKALSAALHAKGKTLSAAVVSDGSGGAGVLTEVFSYIDMLNVMAYDGGTPHSPYSLATASITYWAGRGCPQSKIILGVPFYGRSPETAYNTLVAQDASAPNKDQIGTVYYNGIKTIQDKTRLALQQGGGIMIWELSQDATGSASLLTAIDNVVKGLAFNPKNITEKEQGKFYFENATASGYAGAAGFSLSFALSPSLINESKLKRRSRVVIANSLV
jgi:GH18 family chitinase